MTTLADRIDAAARAHLPSDGPGAAIAVAVDGQLRHSSAYGCADLHHRVPMSPDTVMHVASVSKSILAFQVALLAAEDRLDLDADIRPALDLTDIDRPLTAKQLLWHTSGLRDQWDLLVLAGWRMEDVITTGDVVELLGAQQSLSFEPGSEHVYCNTGYTLLALLVEHVTGTSLQAHAQATIFGPLGMDSTHWHTDHRHVVTGSARSYAPDAHNGFQHAVLSYATAGATSLWTTARDLLAWAANLRTATVGGDVVRRLMQTPGRLDDGTELPYGLGLQLGAHRGRASVGHSGADAGFRSHLVTYPSTGVDIVVLANLSTCDAASLARRVADEVHDEPPLPQPRPLAAHEADALAGPYHDPRTGIVHHVVRHGNGVALAGLAANPLHPAGPHRYHRNGDPDAEILLDGRELVIPDSVPVRATRVPDDPSFQVDPEPLVGRYHSAELGITWKVSESDRRDAPLTLDRRKHPPTPLRPITPTDFRARFDAWTGLHGTVEFRPAATGAALFVSTERVRRVRFEREPPSPAR